MQDFIFRDSDLPLLRSALLNLSIQLDIEKDALLEEGQYKAAQIIADRESRCDELRKSLMV